MSKSILFSYTDFDHLTTSLKAQDAKVASEELLRHGSFTFDLQGVSRAASHQIVRHRVASFSQQSQRYVKITRSYGYLKPPSIPDNLRVPVEVNNQKLELSFEDVLDLTRQAEEELVKRGIKAEDSRYLRPNAATTNIVMSMSPRQLLHFFDLRCAPDAQWEIRDVAWAMYASVRLAAPQVFGPLSAAQKSDYVRKRVMLVDELVKTSGEAFRRTPSGELYQLQVQSSLDLSHPVETFVRRY